jgi:hypothetical protein
VWKFYRLSKRSSRKDVRLKEPKLVYLIVNVNMAYISGKSANDKTSANVILPC